MRTCSMIFALQVRYVPKPAPQDGASLKWTVPWLVPKSVLQEVLQKLHLPLPVYSTTDMSTAKMPLFVGEVRLFDQVFTGEPKKSKRDAEASAAEKAILSFLQGVMGGASGIDGLRGISGPDILKKILLDQILKQVSPQQLLTRVM
ncbi:hypothetical protein CBR_g34933 [Chara braunii]|uniref:DRBM domain-containing protein n=1 Tax=Chara braunii TaxID=69332 RepID=A0A388LJW3_CHABU|nr:hypothetical protein CBR_g34933 [Chara braunii]|eukprot:GBG82557.1 hypothetical protein CBR_g34933 [Chara braunii]